MTTVCWSMPFSCNMHPYSDISNMITLITFTTSEFLPSNVWFSVFTSSFEYLNDIVMWKLNLFLSCSYCHSQTKRRKSDLELAWEANFWLAFAIFGALKSIMKKKNEQTTNKESKKWKWVEWVRNQNTDVHLGALMQKVLLRRSTVFFDLKHLLEFEHRTEAIR